MGPVQWQVQDGHPGPVGQWLLGMLDSVQLCPIDLNAGEYFGQ